MSRVEKLELIRIMDEQERRKKARKQAYSPNAGQLPVHLSQKPIRAVFAGNGGGKTALGSNEAIWALDGYNPIQQRYSPSPCRVVVVLDNPDKVSDLWLPELQKWTVIDEEKDCKKRGKPYYTQIKRNNGSELLFMFHDQLPMRFESIEADVIIFDEPPPKKIYIALMRGLRKKGSDPKILFLGTPITAAWMRRELWAPWRKGEADHIECFKYDTDENKENINWEFYEKVFFKSLSEQELRVRRSGEFFDLEGLALSGVFDERVHVIDPFPWPSTNPVVVIIDPHPSKKHVAGMLGADRDGWLYWIKEFASKSPPALYSKELMEFYRGYRVIDIVCDSLGNTPMTGGDGNKSFIEKLNEDHRWIRSTTYEEKNDEQFIENIREVLEIPIEVDNFGRRIPKLRIFRGCNGLISDAENVEWEKWTRKDIDEPTKPKLAIGNRDYLACLKYGLATQISFSATKARKIRTHSPWGGSKANRY